MGGEGRNPPEEPEINFERDPKRDLCLGITTRVFDHLEDKKLEEVAALFLNLTQFLSVCDEFIKERMEKNG